MFHELYCLYSSSQAILKLIQSVRGHFVVVILQSLSNQMKEPLVLIKKEREFI